MKYSGFYSLLPYNWSEYTDKLSPENLKEALRFLRACLLEKDMAFADKVLEENLLNSVREPDALWTTSYRMMEDPVLYRKWILAAYYPNCQIIKLNWKTMIFSWEVLLDDGENRLLSKKLKLSQSFIDIYTDIIFTSKDQFILELLEALYLERTERIIERNLKAAHFPMVKTLADYSFSGVQLPEKLDIEQLTELKFLEQQENLILYGGVGTGKTHLSIALGVQAVNNEKN